MRCERWREELSARLDGEDDPARRRAVDRHLARCAGCRQWLREATALSGMVRSGGPAPRRDLTEAVLATVASQRRVQRTHVLLRLGVAVVGLVQLAFGVVQVISAAMGDGGAMATDGQAATPAHLWHESAAWNIAIGVGFAWIGLRRSRPAGLVPTLTVFVITLAALSVYDLAGGRVEPQRLLGHGFLLLGYLLVLLLSRLPASPTAPPAPHESIGAPEGPTALVPEERPASPALRLIRNDGDADNRWAA